MAVVTKTGNAYPVAGALQNVSARVAESEATVFASFVDMAVGDSIGSLLYFGRVPSSALIHPASRVYNQALGAAVTLRLGFYKPNGGVVLSNNALTPTLLDMNTADLSGLGKPLNGLTVLLMHMPAWQLANLSADPGGLLDIVGEIQGAAVGTAGRILMSCMFGDHS